MTGSAKQDINVTIDCDERSIGFVNEEDNRWMAARGGKKFHFCCKECRDRFMEIEV